MEGTAPAAPVVQEAQAEVVENDVSTPVEAQAIPDFKGTKHKLKVNGADLELPYEELVARAQKAAAADERFQQAAKLQREVAELINKSKSNPDEFFNLLGLDPVQYAEQKLRAIVEEASLSDEEKQQRQSLRELEELRQWKKQQEEVQTKAQREAEEQAVMQQIDTEISEVLKSAGLDETSPRDVARVAEYLLASLSDESAPRMTAKDAFEKVRGDYLQDLRRFVKKLPIEQKLEFLGDDLIKELRKHDIDKVKGGTLPKAKASAAPTKGDEQKKPKARSMDEFFNSLQPGNRLEI